MIFAISDTDWQAMSSGERAIAVAKKGAGFSLLNVKSLRVDVAKLAGQNVRSLRIDTARFIAALETFTDFHASDIADYVARFDVVLLDTGITSEQQIIELLEDGISMVQGPILPLPVRCGLIWWLKPSGPRVRNCAAPSSSQPCLSWYSTVRSMRARPPRAGRCCHVAPD